MAGTEKSDNYFFVKLANCENSEKVIVVSYYLRILGLKFSVSQHQDQSSDCDCLWLTEWWSRAVSPSPLVRLRRLFLFLFFQDELSWTVSIREAFKPCSVTNFSLNPRLIGQTLATTYLAAMASVCFHCYSDGHCAVWDILLPLLLSLSKYSQNHISPFVFVSSHCYKIRILAVHSSSLGGSFFLS